MLSDEERREIEAEIAHYPDPRAASVDALKIVQRHRGGWVDDEAIADVGEILGLSPAAVDAVATFYSLVFREPVGRHVILVCDSVSCWIRGYPALRDHLRERLGVDLGGTTDDGSFTLLPIPCLGACDHAPVLMVDDDLHRDVGPEDVEGILARYVEEEKG